MAFNPTEDQKLAIYEKGSIIVSAAAGSGKTAVLVERVADILVGKGGRVDADKLLIVTFTNAAAAELRARIEKRMLAEFEGHKDDPFYQRQQILLSATKICTIDSFCIDFLKENYEACGLNPSFKICDNATLSSLESTAMLTLIDECFKSGGVEFIRLLDFFGDSYDDSKLKEAIKKAYDFSRKMPFPDVWLDSIAESYSAHAAGETDTWFESAVDEAEIIAEDALIKIRQAYETLTMDDLAFEKCRENFEYYLKFCEELVDVCETRDWNNIRSFALSLNPPKAGSIKKELKTDIADRAIDQRNDTKKLIGKLLDVVYGDKDAISEEIRIIMPQIALFVELVKRYGAILYDLIREQDLLTFYMAEQAVLSVLAEPFGGAIVGKPEAKEFSEKYKAILVDEYQDTNSLQDTLFHILSDSGKNLFCVGDMKQSIYRFRGSNPLHFLEKKSKASPPDVRKADETLRVDLQNNFRSRHEICHFINSVFEKILYKKNSDFDYDDKEALRPEAEFPDNSELKVELHFCDFDLINASSNQTYDSRVEAEAQVIADLVQDNVSKPPFLKGDDALRRCEYGDITILVRSMSSSGIPIIKALKDRGIPVSASVGDVLDSDEVQTLLALLKVINNPFDDISLVTVLSSPIFGFSFDEIACIRSERPFGNYISAVTFSAKLGNKKAEDFLSAISRFRRMVAVSSVTELIDDIFEEANLLNIFSLMEYGDLKRLNLLCVQNFARTFEGTVRRDLKSFISYFESLENKDFALSSDSKNCVTVTTIHKSKGLQYPVCILADAAKKTNEKDLGGQVLLSESLGVSVAYTDDLFVKHDNFLLRSAMKCEEKKLLFAEELRLLYVAMTRAEEKLIIMSTFKGFDKKISDLEEGIRHSGSTKRVEYPLFRKCKSYSDLLTASLIIDGKKKAILGDGTDPIIFTHKTVDIKGIEHMDAVENVVDNDVVLKLKEAYSRQYKFAPLLELQSKSSVTDIVHKADDKLYRFSKRPAFLQENGLSSAEKGTAIHKVMQYANFEACLSDLAKELERLHEYMYLTDREYDAVDTEPLRKFFSSELFARINSAETVKREIKFLTEFPATALKKELDSEFSSEMVVVQGAVDLLFIENGKVNIVDFKTDRTKDPSELLEAYSEQLKIYAKACNKLLKLPIGDLLIYSFSLGDWIRV